MRSKLFFTTQSNLSPTQSTLFYQNHLLHPSIHYRPSRQTCDSKTTTMLQYSRQSAEDDD
ncbi:hypothetical protein K0M31_013008 [Melipona bicolor]|uniref:Uncharacterized protein n=1 Tax=Melipona bicolor TaxID=60889 RepID=A0AA40KGW1_9HYME|nr:hypothetical protein K0M31_013008 [Melipona bicolor]